MLIKHSTQRLKSLRQSYTLILLHHADPRASCVKSMPAAMAEDWSMFNF